jgi:diguanylate cyclase (GGDEF)-like protein
MVDDTSQNILDEIVIKDSNFVRSNLLDKNLRLKNENTLALMNNQDIQSLYVLYLFQDKYFFLLDTDNVESSSVSEPFIPDNIKAFREVSLEKKKQIFVQDKIKDLSFTLIKPIIQNNKTVGLLIIDYTENRLSVLLNVSVQFLSYLMFALLSLLFLFIAYIIYTRYRTYKMYHNPETNTLNRIYMTDNYEKIDFKKYYVALADIDFFKRVNNLYGQKNGDKIIVSMIQVMTPWLDKKDMLIQYSGEEFLFLILKEKRTEEKFRNLLEEIRVAVEETRFKIDNDSFSLTISMGALLNTEQEKSFQDVIHKADTALYESKHAGRNRICYFDISQTQKLYREKIKEMIECDKLVCYYQAIRDLETGELHHYEALLRIVDGDNIIFPDKILPSLEDSYLYTYLTKRVIEYNVKKLRENSKIKIAINLSADDLVNESILSILAQNADLSNRLYIEILENKSIDYKKVEFSLQKLKLFGYKICIDDFGSGYSNLNHLLNLSIDYLKIDGSIIKEVPYDKRAYSIVKTFAIFCQQNNMEMIAEFIDSQEVVDILKSFGVKYGQGWYYAKALPYEELDQEHK